MKLTKLQRHTAYIIMLAYLDDEKVNIGRKCFCYTVFDLFNIYEEFERLFPELRKKKPIIRPLSCLWFPRTDEGINKRIALLKQCIEETY